MNDKIKELPFQSCMSEKEVAMAKEFYEKVKSGEITHGVTCYRTKSGYIHYQTYNSEHFTYLIGLMERAKSIMIEDYHALPDE